MVADPLLVIVESRAFLGRLFYSLGYTVGAEIGVWKGDFSALLLEENPKLEMYLVDPYHPYKGYASGKRDYEVAWKTVTGRFLNKDVHFLRKPSREAAEDIPDGSLDFVYIDANHEGEYPYQDMVVWEPKVRMGGILSGHDYIERWPDVRKAVQRFMEEKKASIWFLVEVNGRHDTDVSWLWHKGTYDQG